MLYMMAVNVSKKYFRHATDVEKHTQTRKPLRQAYIGYVKGWLAQ